MPEFEWADWLLGLLVLVVGVLAPVAITASRHGLFGGRGQQEDAKFA